jgi:hypothetical protein
MSGPGVAAGATNGALDIIWMNTLLHNRTPLLRLVFAKLADLSRMMG